MDKIYESWKHQQNENISGGYSKPGNRQNL